MISDVVEPESGNTRTSINEIDGNVSASNTP